MSHLTSTRLYLTIVPPCARALEQSIVPVTLRRPTAIMTGVWPAGVTLGPAVAIWNKVACYKIELSLYA